MSLQNFVHSYIERFPEDCFVVDEPTDIYYEPTAYVNALKKKSPLILFKHMKAYEDFKLVTNVFGKRERFAFALGTTVGELNDRLNETLSYSREAEILGKDAPVKERVELGDKASLLSLPVVKHYQEDGAKTANTGSGRYITAGLVAARDPSSSQTLNLSFARIQVLDSKRFALAMVSRRHLWKYYETAKSKGEALPISVIVGCHPAYYILAAARIENEYSKVTRVIPGSLTEGVTNNVPVPYDSEVVIEGEILPFETYEEGPFSEFTGVVSGRSTNNVAQVKAILRKNNPTFMDISPSNSAEHILLTSTAKQARITKTLNDYLPPAASPYRVEWPIEGSTFLASCSIAKPIRGVAKQLGLLLLGLDSNLKFVMVSEGGYPLDLKRFLANLALSDLTLHENLEVLPACLGTMLDPVAASDITIGKAIMIAKANAGAKITETFDAGSGVITLSAGSSKVVFSHSKDAEGKINVVFDKDVDIANPEETTWALATRLDPAQGITLSDGKLVIRTAKTLLSKPTLPADVVRRVESAVSAPYRKIAEKSSVK